MFKRSYQFLLAHILFARKLFRQANSGLIKRKSRAVFKPPIINIKLER